MKSKKVFFVVVVALAVFGFATFSDAACNMYGKVVMAYTAGGATYFYVAPNVTLPTHYVYFVTTNSNIIGILNGAQTAHLKVLVYGNAASCPTVTGSGGTVTAVYRYSNY